MAPDNASIRKPLETAPQYAALGLAVIPECSPTCTCTHPGKRPWDPVDGRHMAAWQQRGLPPGGDLDRWTAAPGAEHLNIGCRCGPGCLGADGLIGADADGESGIAELAGHLGLASDLLIAAVHDYRERGVFVPNLGSAAYLTQSGGLRALWRAEAGANLRTVGGDRGHDGLGLYWQGKQVVLPPSHGPAGEYRWLPGHSPWQVGIALAPPSVLAAMAASTIRISPNLDKRPTSVRAYQPATANLGPDRDGQLLDASKLPYDLDLFRNGVPQGKRSEAVRRLELQMLGAGWNAEQVVAALVGQPWIRSMRRNMRRWLTTDVTRAQEWRSEQVQAENVGDQQEATTPGDRAPDHLAPGEFLDHRDDKTPTAPGWAYGRQRDGNRLRTREAERDEAIQGGLRQIHDFVARLPDPTRSHQRILRQTERLQGSYDRCRQKAMTHHHELRDARLGTGVGGAWIWSDAPCDGRGHEDCAPYHALRELNKQWGPALEEAYGSGPVVALAFLAPGWGLEATRKASMAFLAGSKVRAALGLCAGFLSFEPGAARGYALHLLVPSHHAQSLRDLLLREWRRHVACGWVRPVDDLPAQPTALEALVELRVRSEQAILLAAGRGEVELERAVGLYAVEIGAFSGSAVGGRLHRLVMAPGMRALARDIAARRQRVAQAVGDARGAEYPGSGGEEASEPPVPATAGKGPEHVSPFPLSGPAVPPGPSPTRPGCGSAGESHPGTASRTDDGEGWVPCPWDPSLERRTTQTRKGRPRALPWWKLEQMAARGEVVPIVYNGRLVGYRTPPGNNGSGRP